MAIRYDKLMQLLKDKGLQKNDLLPFFSSATIVKLAKGGNINTSVITTICAFLDCQPGDIMEYVDEGETGDIISINDEAAIAAYNRFKETYEELPYLTFWRMYRKCVKKKNRSVVFMNEDKLIGLIKEWYYENPEAVLDKHNPA